MNDAIGKHTGTEALCKSSKAMQPKEQENQKCREVFAICLQMKNSDLGIARTNFTPSKELIFPSPQQNLILFLN